MAMKHLVVAFATALLLSVGASTYADAPKTVATPDRHSVEVKGKVSLYRVQIEGMKLGEGKNISDTELFVSLDSDPKMVYTLDLKSNSPEANRVMAETLRDAYINKLPVTIYHQIPINRDNNLKILMVQFD